MEELPGVLQLHVLRFLDHSALHAAELTSPTLLRLTQQFELWRALAENQVTSSEELHRPELWKRMLCLAQRGAADDSPLLGGVANYSSADRQSEGPTNTLTSSRCWMELHQQHVTDVEQGERIQHCCGCSTGQSCYWSSSASTDENAAEYIDYELNGPCIVAAVQIVPYRVFWHPGSPTYAPKRVRFEFFDEDAMALQQRARNRVASLRPPTISPFYVSSEYEVKNDMTLQEFTLPRKLAVSKTTVLRITLLGRHQAQTFELPQMDNEEDRVPKYYCCLSYVNVRGVQWKPVQRREETPPQDHRMSRNLRMAALTGLAVYMTTCYEGFVGRTRRWE